MSKIFISHTHKDKNFCDRFDIVCARVGIASFRSEFEHIQPPAWRTIREAIRQSTAVFFLVGKELVQDQKEHDQSWEYTQNWIAYEIGLACQRGLDVWALCDDVNINFPMPYINNYSTVTLDRPDAFDYMRHILKIYKEGGNFPYPHGDCGYVCAYEDCGIEFNLHVELKIGERLTCPQCLRTLERSK